MCVCLVDVRKNFPSNEEKIDKTIDDDDKIPLPSRSGADLEVSNTNKQAVGDNSAHLATAGGGGGASASACVL